ncbi:MAG: hypothetical protein Q9186_001463 [Xanthomendoza sp. 1 TL-2023]
MPKNVFSFGITILERSQDLVSDRDFLVPLIEVVENVYRNHRNASAVVRSYAWPRSDMGMRIGAIDRGRDEELSIAFNYDAMVLFTRWLGQSYKPYMWTKFQCHYGWRVDGEVRKMVVAEGNFTSFKTAGPPILEQPARKSQR